MDTSLPVVAVLTRSVTFVYMASGTAVVFDAFRFPPGTEVYASPAQGRMGWFRVRIPGTLFSQVVSPDSVRVS